MGALDVNTHLHPFVSLVKVLLSRPRIIGELRVRGQATSKTATPTGTSEQTFSTYCSSGVVI